jgi:hypothetical protein
MSHQTPGRAASGALGRPQRRHDACEITTTARKLAGDLTQLALATDAGCTPQTIQRMEDPSDLGHHVHADVWLAPLIAKSIVRVLAEREGMIVIEIPRVALGGAVHKSIAEIAKETADVVSGAAVALADGDLSADEKRELRGQIREAQEALARLDHMLTLDDEPGASVHPIGAKR